MEDRRLQSGRAVKWDESGKACPERVGVAVRAESYQARGGRDRRPSWEDGMH